LSEQDPLDAPYLTRTTKLTSEERREIRQKRQDIAEETGKPQKNGETTTWESRRAKNLKNNTGWLSIQQQ